MIFNNKRCNNRLIADKGTKNKSYLQDFSQLFLSFFSLNPQFYLLKPFFFYIFAPYFLKKTHLICSKSDIYASN